MMPENHSNVAEYVRKLRTDFERGEAQLAPYVRYLVKKSERSWRMPVSINQSVKREKQCVAESVSGTISINSPPFSIVEYFGDIILTNFS